METLPPVPCTLSYFGKNRIEQIWYNCWTCSQKPSMGVCYACAHICHKGHQLGNQDQELGLNNYNRGKFFCDCANGAFDVKCQCLQVVKPSTSVIELADTQVDYQIVKSAYSFSPCSIVSPMNLKMALELGGAVFDCNDVVMPFIKSKYTEVPSPYLFVGCGVFGAKSANTQGISFDCMVTEKSGKQIINEFVDTMTRGMIPDLLTQEPIGITVVSTLYFKGEWAEPFDEHQTSENYEFDGLNGTTKIPVMRKFGNKKNTKFMVTKNLKSLILPYVGDRFVAILTLPRIGSLHDMLSDPPKIFYDQWKEHLQMTDVMTLKIRHFVPKFSKRFKYDNMGQILEKAGFDYVAFKNKSKIDDIIHEVVIEMDEKGTRGSAATGLVSRGMSETDDEWIGDRPYMMAIVDTLNKSILFAGVMDFTC